MPTTPRASPLEEQRLLSDDRDHEWAAEILQESEARYRALFNDSRDAILVTTPGGGIIDVNPAFLGLLGYTREELLKLNIRRLYVHPIDQHRLQQELERKGSVRDFETRFRRKDGTEMTCLHTTSVRRAHDGSILEYQGIIRDITERKALEEMWRRYEFIANTSKEFMTLINKDLIYEAANEAYCHAHSKTRGEIVGKTVVTVWGKERYSAQVKQHLHKCFAGNEVHYEGWFEFATLGTRYFHVVYYPYYNDEGTVTHVVVVSRDITAHKRAEEKLKRLSLVIDAMVDGVTITDLHGRISYVNRAVTEQLGYRQEELVGKTPAILVTESDLPKIATQAQEVLLGKTLSKSTEYLARHRDGIGIPISMTFSVLRGSEGQPREIIAVSRDITERKRLEEQLRQSQKMEAIGRLAASLAHEINNPLQALSSGLRLLGRADLDERKRSQYLTITNREVNRLIGIVERVIGFYRPPTDMPSPTDIHVLLDETLVLAREKLLQSHITVQRDWAGDLPLVDAIADQLEQVFLNLILNAIGAMPDGGTLAVSTGRTKDDSAIGVRFADTGHGIAPEHFDHIFEPFYTTQPQGMGLGLAISYNIVKQHGGNIEVESQPGEGAAFTVTLPLG